MVPKSVQSYCQISLHQSRIVWHCRERGTSNVPRISFFFFVHGSLVAITGNGITSRKTTFVECNYVSACDSRQGNHLLQTNVTIPTPDVRKYGFYFLRGTSI